MQDSTKQPSVFSTIRIANVIYNGEFKIETSKDYTSLAKDKKLKMLSCISEFVNQELKKLIKE